MTKSDTAKYHLKAPTGKSLTFLIVVFKILLTDLQRKLLLGENLLFKYLRLKKIKIKTEIMILLLYQTTHEIRVNYLPYDVLSDNHKP